MKKNQHFYQIIIRLLVVIFACITNNVAIASAGKVQFATAGATILAADGSSKAMVKGLDISQGDTILTGEGRAQVKFSDGAYLSFQPNTEFKVEEYNFNGQQDGTEKGFFRLVKGGLRAISGLVGREHKPAYKLSTSVATIGIRGTYYLAEFNEKLKAHVGQGSVYIYNEFGDIILFKGQGAVVYPGKAPVYSEEEMTLGARGPQGGQPDETNDQELVDNQNNSIFKVAEQYTDDGIACLNGNCDIASAITNLNGIVATAYYVLDNAVANNGGGMGWTSKVGDSSNLSADFGNYSITGQIYIESTRPATVPTYLAGPLSAFDSFSVSGSILKSGYFATSGQYNTDGGSVCNSTCSINLIGLFNGAQAEKANIGYVINGAYDTATGNTGQIKGTAGIIKGAIPIIFAE